MIAQHAEHAPDRLPCGQTIALLVVLSAAAWCPIIVAIALVLR